MRFKTFAILLLAVLLVGCTQQAPEKSLFEQQTVNTKDVTPHAMPAALRLIMAGKRE